MAPAAVGPSSILFDARTVRPGMSGVGRYALNLLSALAARPEAPPLRALFLREGLELARQDPALGPVELLEAPLSHEAHPAGDLWLRLGLPRLVRPGEVFHGPAFILPGGRQPFARVVTIHDLFVFTHPQYFPLKFRAWLRWATRRACRFADRIIVPTQTVADQLKEHDLAQGRKIHVIGEAPDASGELWEAHAPSNFNDNELFALERVSSRESGRLTFVTIGALEARKDPATARAAHLELVRLLKEQGRGDSVDWFWFGGSGTAADPAPEGLKREAARLGFKTVGYAPQGVIRRVLAQATAYITCSRSEGFGIPLLEAMAAGCPVVASDIPAHREVAGKAALFFPPGDAPALARALATLLADVAKREELIGKGRQRLARFSWNLAAEQTLQVYREALRGPAGSV